MNFNGMEALDAMRSELKQELRTLRIISKEMDRLDRAYENNPENAEIENKWDRTYKAEQEQFGKCTAMLVKFSGGQINRETARMLLLDKRGAVEALI